MNNKATTTGVVSMVAVAIYATTAAYAGGHDDEHRYHDSHEHGVVQLNIAQEGDTLHLELESPAMNIVGFEHMPGDTRQHAAVDSAVAQFKKGEQLFHFSTAAKCKLLEAKVESGLMENDYDAHDEHEAGEENGHADFEVSYLFKCAQPDQLNSVEVGLFKIFPATEELGVQMITDRGQKSLNLTPSNASLKF